MLDIMSNQPEMAIALSQLSPKIDMSYGELTQQVKILSTWLTNQKIRSVALSCQNSIDWVIVDLACQEAGVIITPIPLFFSLTQQKHLLDSVMATLLFSDQEMPLQRVVYPTLGHSYTLLLSAYVIDQKAPINAPIGTAKITFTSGSTGSPKGVCLSLDNQLTVAKSLVDVIKLEQPRHLCLLPFPTLLENIAGIYSPLIAGGTVIIANDGERGFNGSRLVDIEQFLLCITNAQPHSIILVPELLQVLIHALMQGWSAPKSLKFIAVGGSRVSQSLIEKAHQFNLPVFQGYGLSECCSVVSLTNSLDNASDSVGRLLPHISAKITKGELIVNSNCFLGYLDLPESWYPTQVNTGDLVKIENEQLFIAGRIKNLIINSFGRNISPEWLESEFLASGLFQQAVVIGDSKPYCIALLALRDKVTHKNTLKTMDKFIAQLNTTLPDYAQIKDYLLLPSPMTYEEGLLTENGRVKRDAIQRHFANYINKLYAQHYR